VVPFTTPSDAERRAAEGATATRRRRAAAKRVDAGGQAAAPSGVDPLDALLNGGLRCMEVEHRVSVELK
jgi:hypothetical protein